MLDRKRPDPWGGLLVGGCVRTMLRRWIAPCVLAAVALVGVACGSSTPAEPTPAEPTPAPVEDPKPTTIPVADPEPTPVLAADPEPTLVPADEPQPNSVPAEEAEEADALRQMAFDYWEAFNAYDADRVLEFLEEGYGQEREEKIRGDIGRLKLFSVQLGVTEESPPSIVGEDEREMYLTMKEPLGTRRIRMAFREVGGEWKITFSEEVE